MSQEGEAFVWKPGERAFVGAGIEVTDQLKDCALCTHCGVYGRKELVRERGCFRCMPRAKAREGMGGLVLTGFLLAFAIMLGALVALWLVR